MPVGRVRSECGEPADPALTRIGDLAHHLLARQKPHQKGVAAGEVGHRRKRDDVKVGVAGDRLDRLDLSGEQRAEDQADALADRGMRGIGRTRGRSSAVARDQGQLVAAGLEQRQLRRVEDGLPEPGIGS